MTKRQRTNNDISNTTKHQLSTKHYTKNKRFRNTKPTKTMIYKTASWKLKAEQHKHNKTPIIYKTLHRKLKI
jgi:hypothetical protein